MRTKLILVAASLASLALTAACNDTPAEPEPPPKNSAAAAPQIPDPPELVIEDPKPGTGDREVKKGDKIKVKYTGRLLRTNFKFDSTDGKKEPFEFTVGEGVIEGWSLGVVGMKKGGVRKLTIPSRLAYKEAGSPPKIPASAPLTFDIELVAFSDEDVPKDAGAGGGHEDGGDKEGAKEGDKKDGDKKDEKKKPDAEPKKDEKKVAPKPSTTSAP